MAINLGRALEHKATLGGRNGLQSLAAKSLLLMADEHFNLLLLGVGLGTRCLLNLQCSYVNVAVI